MDNVRVKAVAIDFLDDRERFYWKFEEESDTFYVREVVRFEDNWIRISRRGLSVAFPRERVKDVQIFS